MVGAFAFEIPVRIIQIYNIIIIIIITIENEKSWDDLTCPIIHYSMNFY